jgi:hypothetical protein
VASARYTRTDDVPIARWLDSDSGPIDVMLIEHIENAYRAGRQLFPSQVIDAPGWTSTDDYDIGFRVDPQETQRNGKLTRTWVVHVNGQWIEPQAALKLAR